MEIGNLNQRIDFLEHQTVTDLIGNHITRWEKTFSCWAYVSVKTSSETTDSGITKEVQSLEFTIRQTKNTRIINPTTHRIQFLGILYDINSVILNFKSQNYMKIVAVARKSGDIYGGH
ncbi:MAG: phage head closure protein [Ruminococcus sp.]